MLARLLLAALAKLAGYTAICVFEAYDKMARGGGGTVLAAQDSLTFTIEPVDMMEKYQYEKREGLQRRTLKTLERELDIGTALSSL